MLTLLEEGAAALEFTFPKEALSRCLQFQALLFRWNQRFNLTAILDPQESVEKHLLDSLVVARVLESGCSLMDLGAGAGLPSVPLTLCVPGLRVLAVDAVMKKVLFLKQVVAELGLAGRLQARHLRAEGRPDAEGVPRSDFVVSRAVMDLGPWLGLARHYLSPGGRVVAMLGREVAGARVSQSLASEHAERHGARLVQYLSVRLPWSGSERAVATFGWD